MLPYREKPRQVVQMGTQAARRAPGQYPGHRLPLNSRVHLPSLSCHISKISGVAASVHVLQVYWKAKTF